MNQARQKGLFSTAKLMCSLSQATKGRVQAFETLSAALASESIAWADTENQKRCREGEGS